MLEIIDGDRWADFVKEPLVKRLLNYGPYLFPLLERISTVGAPRERELAKKYLPTFRALYGLGAPKYLTRETATTSLAKRDAKPTASILSAGLKYLSDAEIASRIGRLQRLSSHVFTPPDASLLRERFADSVRQSAAVEKMRSRFNAIVDHLTFLEKLHLLALRMSYGETFEKKIHEVGMAGNLAELERLEASKTAAEEVAAKILLKGATRAGFTKPQKYVSGKPVALSYSGAVHVRGLRDANGVVNFIYSGNARTDFNLSDDSGGKTVHFVLSHSFLHGLAINPEKDLGDPLAKPIYVGARGQLPEKPRFEQRLSYAKPLSVTPALYGDLFGGEFRMKVSPLEISPRTPSFLYFNTTEYLRKAMERSGVVTRGGMALPGLVDEYLPAAAKEDGQVWDYLPRRGPIPKTSDQR